MTTAGVTTDASPQHMRRPEAAPRPLHAASSRAGEATQTHSDGVSGTPKLQLYQKPSFSSERKPSWRGAARGKNLREIELPQRLTDRAKLNNAFCLRLPNGEASSQSALERIARRPRDMREPCNEPTASVEVNLVGFWIFFVMNVERCGDGVHCIHLGGYRRVCWPSP